MSVSKAIQKHQALIDIAIQYSGSAEKLFELADINGLGITDVVAPGTLILIPDVVQDEKVVKFLRDGDHRPITRIPSDEELMGEGIEFWGIEFDFIVS